MELDERLRTRAARPLHAGRAADGGHRRRARRAGLGRRRADRRRRPRRPGDGTAGHRPHRRRCRRWACSSRRPRPTSTQVVVDGRVVVRDGRHLAWTCRPSCPRRRSRRSDGPHEQHAGRQHRRAGHQRCRRGPAGHPSRDAALLVEDGRVAWVGPSADAPAADRRLDAGGRGRAARLRGQPRPPGLRRGPRRGVRRADGRRALHRRRHPHHCRRHPGRHRRRAAGHRAPAARRRRCARAPRPSRSRAGTG